VRRSGKPRLAAYDRRVGEELPRPATDVVSRELGDQAVLVHLGTNRIYSLNPTGTRFWSLLVSGAERDAIERQLLAEFDVSEDELRRELDQLLASLQEEGLVE
jgi:Coenzyme PQQ synthesis protein D (PqqD)